MPSAQNKKIYPALEVVSGEVVVTLVSSQLTIESAVWEAASLLSIALLELL